MKDDPMNILKVKRGVALPHARLTVEDVINIRQLIEARRELVKSASELTNEKIAEKFGVHRRTIERLSVGETWWHV